MSQYDRVGKQYLVGQKAHFRKRKDEPFEFIKNVITKPDFKNKKILDAGCGDGRYMAALRKLGARNVYGLDESKIMLSEAKRLGMDPKRLFLRSIVKSRLPSKSFDIIYGRFSLQHLKNLDPMYKEASRLLRKGGVLVLAVPHPMRDLFLIKSQEYKSGQAFTIRLFKNKVPIVCPMHPFREYFSPTFLHLFQLKSFGESRSPHIHLKGFKVPEFLGIAAVKK